MTASDTTVDDCLAYFEERGGVREFDGSLSRGKADRLALADTVAALGSRPSLH